MFLGKYGDGPILSNVRVKIIHCTGLLDRPFRRLPETFTCMKRSISYSKLPFGLDPSSLLLSPCISHLSSDVQAHITGGAVE